MNNPEASLLRQGIAMCDRYRVHGGG